MKNEVQYASTTRRSPAYLRGARLRNALLLAPFALGLAGAQTGAGAGDIDSMAGVATGGAGSVKTAVLAIAGIVVTIGLLIWGASKLKPRG